jgi:hypothetical protein
MSNSDIVHSIVQGYTNIERVHSIEKEREETMSTKEFQEWCTKMHIGSRVERVDSRATELMSQYSDYPKWVARMY